MLRALLISIFAIFFSIKANSQCTISVLSTDGYTVNITLLPIGVVATTPCLTGYTYNTLIGYDISFSGSKQPKSLKKLEGTLGCGSSTHFFPLSKTPATGLVLSQSNVATTLTNCATATLASFGCNTFNITIEGPGISTRVVSCSYAICNAGTAAPSLSATTKSNSCPATTADLSTITASNTPIGAVLEWHTATPVTAANKVALPNIVTAGNYYAVFYDAINNCYSPASAAVAVKYRNCLLAGNSDKDFVDKSVSRFFCSGFERFY